MNDITPLAIIRMSIKELWDTVKALTPDKITPKIEMGYQIKIPIYYFLQDWITIYPDDNDVLIRGHRHEKFDMITVIKEQEQREQALRQILFDYINKEQLGTDEVHE